ncbi:MAG TPA: AI-2E family transporter [Candidatus Tectomicrobia bacterium]|nr:AI-2E family transporter [Candidatus Tectomicrobia bacterium]
METPRREIVLPRGIYVAGVILIAGYVVYWLRGVLTPILLAFIIAYILDPLVDQLESWKVPRPAGIAIVLGVVLGAWALFLALVLPGIAADVAGVIQEIPKQLANLWAKIEPWLERRGIAVPHSTTEWVEHLSAYASEVGKSILAPAGSVLSSLMGGTLSLIGSVVAALVVLVLAVYLLNDFDHITTGAKELIPLRWRPTVMSYTEEIDQILSHFMRGQLTVMAILAVLYSAAYAALGVRLAVPIGIVAGILNFIPYLGSAFALAAGVLMSLLNGWHIWQLVGVVIAYTAVQALEGFVITPRIVGKTVGLSEIWVLVALFVGGEVFGFLGVLLAVPAAAVAKIFVVRAVQHYRQTELFLQAPPESVPDRRLASYEELANVGDVEPDRRSPTPPGSAQRES